MDVDREEICAVVPVPAGLSAELIHSHSTWPSRQLPLLAVQMRGLLGFISALCLFASLLGGAVVHAAEIGGNGAPAAATAWLHADGDHDQVPPDSDNDTYHHHASCSGHDLAAPLKGARPMPGTECAASPHSITPALLRAGPPAALLRPPIA